MTMESCSIKPGLSDMPKLSDFPKNYTANQPWNAQRNLAPVRYSLSI
jgi:hypothetical protein